MSTNGFTQPSELPPQMQERIAASKDYDMLQGLVSVWAGAGIILAALTGRTSWLAIMCGLGAAVGASWYQKRYGKQRSSTNRTAVTLVVSVVFILSVSIATGMDHWHPGPVLWGPLVSALAAANVLGYRHIGATPWHWVCAAGVAASSLGPLVGWHPSRIGSLVPLGLALIITGYVDHARLVRILGKGNTHE